MKWRDIICFQWHALWNGRFPPALIILFLPLLYAFLFGTIYSRNVVNNLAFTPGIVVFIRKRKLLNAAGVGHREVFQRLLGAVLPFEAIALCSFCLSLGVCIIVYGLPMRGSLWDCLFLMTCFLFFLLCVLTFFGSGAASVVEAMQDPMIYIMPGVLFSGLSWPTFCMNDIGGAISLLLPMTWVGDCLRDILLAGYAPQLYKDSLVLVCAGLVIGAVSVFRIVRRIRKEGAAL